MKKISLVVTSILVLVISLILINGCKVDNNKNDYLRKVLGNLDQIKSATYYNVIEPFAPGDTSPTYIMRRYIKEYTNPADSNLGTSYVMLLQVDTSKMESCYDGIANTYLNWDEKTITIDSTYRTQLAPFFNYAKSIIKYALETNDSISLILENSGDSVHLKLAIFAGKQVEFHGKPYYYDNPYNGEQVSKYDIWINKSNNLPYRIQREMSHEKFVWTCSNVNLNKVKIEDFIASDYFPSDFNIKIRGKDISIVISDLEGELAPDWVLKDANNNLIALEKLKSKVIVIQFTSVSCGPCRASIPFLKQLVSEYSEKDFDFVSIESWTRNSNVLKSYQGRNDFSYKFLMSTKEVTKSYQIQAVPMFYILDKNRVIRKVIRGYGEGTTDKEIRDAINELI
jgi:thiol-disulfide isomerase/thioredoxin